MQDAPDNIIGKCHFQFPSWSTRLRHQDAGCSRLSQNSTVALCIDIKIAESQLNNNTPCSAYKGYNYTAAFCIDKRITVSQLENNLPCSTFEGYLHYLAPGTW